MYNQFRNSILGYGPGAPPWAEEAGMGIAVMEGAIILITLAFYIVEIFRVLAILPSLC